MILKKLADRLVANPKLLSRVRESLDNGTPLWVCGVMEDEADVRDTIRAMEAR